MQSKYSLTGKKLKQSFVHHNTRPGTAFFPWLKRVVLYLDDMGDLFLVSVNLRKVTNALSLLI